MPEPENPLPPVTEEMRHPPRSIVITEGDLVSEGGPATHDAQREPEMPGYEATPNDPIAAAQGLGGVAAEAAAISNTETRSLEAEVKQAGHENEPPPEDELATEIEEATATTRAVLERIKNNPNFPDRENHIATLESNIRETEQRIRSDHEREKSSTGVARKDAMSRVIKFLEGGMNYMPALAVEYQDGKPKIRAAGGQLGIELSDRTFSIVAGEVAELVGASMPPDEAYTEDLNFVDNESRQAEVQGDPGLKVVLRRLYKKPQSPEEPHFSELISEEIIVAKSGIELYPKAD